jgi:hypothetical protein
LEKREIGYPFPVMKVKEILSRPRIEKRIKQIEVKRKNRTPFARGFLDGLLSTKEGTGTKGVN